ncbi:MAG: chromophore lyase CpcT/CpeT, partial [Cyanobacteria bacterium J06633_2]
MDHAQSSSLIAQWLAGEFSNRDQALESPVWFVKLVLWHRPIPHLLDNCLAIFAEQANALDPSQSYRQRVFTLSEDKGSLNAQYFGFKRPSAFKGAGVNPSLLNHLSLDDLERLPGCVLEIERKPNQFSGRMRSGDRCRFHYDNKVGQVILGFDVEADRFLSYDKGVDPETEKPIWGALMG